MTLLLALIAPPAILAILFADLDMWVKILVPMAMVIFWILGQLFGNEKAKPAAPPRRRPARPPRVEGAPRPDAARVEQEVEDFLRRAQQRAGGQAPAKAEVAGRPVARRRPAPPPLVQPAELVAEIVPVDEFARRPSAAERVRERLDARTLQERADALTHLDQADEQLEAHLQEAFGHRVGTLGSTGATPAPRGRGRTPAQIAAARRTPAAPTAAAGFAAMLSSVDNLRQAVVLSEILARPEHRW